MFRSRDFYKLLCLFACLFSSTRCGVYRSYTVSGQTVPYLFVHVGNFGNTSFLTFYLKTDGTLVQDSNIFATGAGTANPSAFQISANNKFLFTSLFNSSNIYAFSIAAMNDDYPSILNPASSTPAIAAGNGTSSIALSPNQSFMYSTSYYPASSNVLSFHVDTNTGGMSALGVASAQLNPSWIAITPSGNNAYVTNQGSYTVSAFTLSPTSGAITNLSGGTYATQSEPIFDVVDPTGQNLLVANNLSNTISTYRINQSTGALTAAANVATGGGPTQIAFHPTLNYVYVSNNTSDSIGAYTIDTSTGNLTPITGSPFTVTNLKGPWALQVDPSGTFLVVSWATSGKISVFNIDPTTGALSAVGSPTAVGVSPRCISVFRLYENE